MAQSVNLNKILAFASEQLADYKVPETLEIVDKIPRNTLGKIDHQLLLANSDRSFVPTHAEVRRGPYCTDNRLRARRPLRPETVRLQNARSERPVGRFVVRTRNRPKSIG